MLINYYLLYPILQQPHQWYHSKAKLQGIGGKALQDSCISFNFLHHRKCIRKWICAKRKTLPSFSSKSLVKSFSCFFSLSHT